MPLLSVTGSNRRVHLGPYVLELGFRGTSVGFVLLLSILMVKVADTFVFVPLACPSEG